MFWDSFCHPFTKALSEATPPSPDNPTDEQRYALTLHGLAQARRPEDFSEVMRLTSLPPDITTIAAPGEFKGRNIKIGIIGAGVAGLSAAFELRKLGYDITIFEANEDRIGGRIFTHYFDEENYGELGAMRIPVTHNASWHYINMFKLNTREYIQSNPNAFIYARNTRVRNDAEGRNVMERIYPKYDLAVWERNVPWAELLSYALDTPLLSMPPALRAQLLEIRRNYDSLIDFWDYYNVRQVMEMSGLSQGAIDMLTSLSPFTRMLLYNSFVEHMMDSNPLSFLYLYEIVGGTSRLPYAFYNSLINSSPSEYGKIPNELLGNVRIHRGTWVDGIYMRNNDKVILSFKNKHMPTSITEEFDYVVCAIPFSTLRNIRINPLFSNEKMQAIREVNYVTAQKTLFLCNRRFWQEGGPSEQIIGGGSSTDLPISTIWYPSDRRPANEPGVLLAAYNLELDATRVDNQLYSIRNDNIKEQVELVHGLPSGYLNEIVERSIHINWNEEPWSLGGFCYYYPEQKRLFTYAAAMPEYNSRVLFAGEHISSSHGWMNGALQSGVAAGNNIARMSKMMNSIY